VIFIVDLARVTFVADGAVEETDCGREGVVAGWHIEERVVVSERVI
jgi:hypothetical protein